MQDHDRLSQIFDELIGIRHQMALNAGESPDLVVQTVTKTRKKNQGWDFATGKMVDVYEAGILDPAKVTRNAIENATSVASTLLTTSYAIIED